MHDAHGDRASLTVVRIQASSAELMLRLLSEFGMTPSSRVRVSRGGPPENPDAVDLFGF